MAGKMQVREGVKIRHYIMSLIYRHPNERRPIPGSNELAAMFQVARSTVTLVLKSLVEEGYLEGRRGIGTFTKHQNFIPVRGEMPPLIGLLAGDGKYFYYPHQVWAVLASCGMELTRCGCNVRPLNLSGADAAGFFDEIARQYLDGLVVFDSQSVHGDTLIRRLREETQLKIVVQRNGCSEEEEDSFGFDYRRAGVEVGEILIAEGRSRLFFIFENPVTVEFLTGIRSAFAAAGKRLELTSFDWAAPGVFEVIREAFAANAPEAVYAHGQHLATIEALMTELRIESAERCRLIAESHVVHPGFRGVALEIPFEEIGRRMGERMRELCADHGSVPVTCRLPVTIRKYDICNSSGKDF